MIKSFLKSKTIWVNVLTIVSGLIVYVQDNDLIVNNPDAVALAGGILALVNVALRFLTDSAIAVSVPKPE